MSNTLKVYQTDFNGVYVGDTEADESPLEPGIFHIPRGCVSEPPPEFGEGERARWTESGWVTEAIPGPLESPEEEPVTVETFRRCIQARVDNTAQSRGYDNGASLASYVASTIPAWASEANAFVLWRDQVWVYAYAELEKVQSGEREQPTVETILSELPSIEWPS